MPCGAPRPPPHPSPLAHPCPPLPLQAHACASAQPAPPQATREQRAHATGHAATTVPRASLRAHPAHGGGPPQASAVRPPCVLRTLHAAPCGPPGARPQTPHAPCAIHALPPLARLPSRALPPLTHPRAPPAPPPHAPPPPYACAPQAGDGGDDPDGSAGEDERTETAPSHVQPSRLGSVRAGHGAGRAGCRETFVACGHIGAAGGAFGAARLAALKG